MIPISSAAAPSAVDISFMARSTSEKSSNKPAKTCPPLFPAKVSKSAACCLSVRSWYMELISRRSS